MTCICKCAPKEVGLERSKNSILSVRMTNGRDRKTGLHSHARLFMVRKKLSCLSWSSVVDDGLVCRLQAAIVAKLHR